jgi:3-hydroxyisobutyrate dehydrogenase-like beta-hydroxyacid dehydrogenase
VVRGTATGYPRATSRGRHVAAAPSGPLTTTLRCTPGNPVWTCGDGASAWGAVHVSCPRPSAPHETDPGSRPGTQGGVHAGPAPQAHTPNPHHSTHTPNPHHSAHTTRHDRGANAHIDTAACPHGPRPGPRGIVSASMSVAIVSPGHMGAGLGWALGAGGARVVATLAGRSARTTRLTGSAGLELLPSLEDVVAAASVVLVVTPPAAAVTAAADIAAAARATGTRPLVADLNAVSPSTMEQIAAVLAPLDLVDGSISGSPPTVRPGARVYLSGARAAEVAGLPWRHVEPIVVGERIGSASAVKMCTASVYKGLVALCAQAMRTGARHGVLDHVLADLATAGLDRAGAVAAAATKAARFVPEMREIAATQRAAGLPHQLFEAFALVYAELAGSPLATQDPESVDRTLTPAQVVAGITPAPFN